jgi:hypothetical protein
LVVCSYFLKHGRSLPACALALALGVLWPALGLAQSSTLSGSPGGGSGGGSTRAIRLRSALAGGISCTHAAQCNDGLACTADLCVEGSCLNLAIPGCVPCNLTYTCPPVDVVFIMDTSGSMRDEAAVLCTQVFAIGQELADAGIHATINSIGITDIPPAPFDCLFDTVVGSFGSVVPGGLDTCVFPGGSDPYESWGPATAIIAQYYPWTPGATRIIVPMSDEGPCNGSRPDGCNDPGDDRDSITNAIAVALANDVIVSPIAGTGADACVINLGAALAKGTGGSLHQLKNPKNEFRTSLIDIIHQTCLADASCDDRDPCTEEDTCVDGRCLGTLTEGCRPCANDPDCDDENVCTADTCVDGYCEWAALHDGDLCCHPVTGSLTPISDGNPCTADACDPHTGNVIHTPLTPGSACNDGENCTIDDVCDETGQCAGTPIYTLSCESDEDCFGNICSLKKNHCVCNEVPELCLEDLGGVLRGEGCYSVGEDLFVQVKVGNNAALIAGGQFLIQYDPAALQYVDVMPGASADHESPFGTEIARTINEEEGELFYAVGVMLGGPLTHGPSVMAVVHFRAIEACAGTEVCFGGDNPKSTRLTDSFGHSLAFIPCCTDELRINGGPPAMDCPANVTLNAEAGTLSASVSWSPADATASCPPGDTSLDCTSSHSKDHDVDHLLMQGGRAPTGVSTFSCTATDGCGSSNACSWTVDVKNLNTVEVDVQLSPTMAAGPLTRCIEFAFHGGCEEPPVVVQKSISFGLPLHLPGKAERVQLAIPPGEYTCVTARDVRHTLTSRSPVSIEGAKFVARFVGDPAAGGNWLLGGNLDENHVIDAVDEALVMAQYLQSVNPNTPCGSVGFHGDLNGDGIVNLADVAMIQQNFGRTSAAPCCGGGTASSDVIREEITLAELSAMGFGDLRAADINGDGVINQADMDVLIRRDGRTKRPGPRNR